MSIATELRPKDAREPDFPGVPETLVLPRLSARLQRLRLLWNSRASLNRAAIAGLAGGALIAFLLPVKYESTTQLMPPDTQSSSGMAMMAALSARGGEAAESVSSDLLGLKSSGALFISILGSRTVEERLVNHFDLRNRYGCPLQEDARRKLAENTAISEDRKSGVITITVTDRDRHIAAEMAATYVDELNRMVTELSTSAAHRERVFLEQRLRDVKQNLNQASKDLSQFASENTALDIKEQGRAMIDAAASLTGQLIAAESEERGLEQIYNPNNVRVRSVQARINELREKIGELQGNPGDGPPGLVAGASKYPTLRSLPLLGVTYSDLYRQSKIQETVYETLTQEYELAKVQEAKETPSVKVLDVPSVPERRSYPPRLQIVLVGISLGLTGAGLWILGKERWGEIDTLDPAKQFAEEIFRTVYSCMPWAERNGSRVRALTKLWDRHDRRNDSTSRSLSGRN